MKQQITDKITIEFVLDIESSIHIISYNQFLLNTFKQILIDNLQ
jgi:hypothetical protein